MRAHRALLISLLLAAAAHLPAYAASQAAKDANRETGKRLEESPEALDKIREILQTGIPERMSVTVPNKATAESGKGGLIRVAAPAENKKSESVKTEAGTPTPAKTESTGKDKGSSPPSPASEATKKHEDTNSTEAGKADAKPAEVKAKPATKPAPKPAAKPNGSAPGTATPVTWSYSGAGAPENWGNLNPAYSLCTKGSRQSPIHIDPAETIAMSLETLTLSYGELMGSMVNTGYTVQMDTSGSNVLSLRGRSYGLQNIQFRHPAEEVINHRGYPMSIQWQHRDFQGNLAVLSVLVEVGQENPAINKLWSRLPFLVQERNPVQGMGTDLNALLPRQLDYYTYTGSLTQPPCSEGVLWVVLKNPITLSPEQIATFAKLYPMNARPVQPGNGRLVQSTK